LIDKEKCQILILQDDPIRYLTKGLLSHFGFKNIYIPSSSVEAFETIENLAPNLIILDYRPIEKNELSGTDLFHELKEIAALENTAYLLYVVWLNREFCQEVKAMGFSGILRMPLTSDELNQACEAVLSGETYFSDCENY